MELGLVVSKKLNVICLSFVWIEIRWEPEGLLIG